MQVIVLTEELLATTKQSEQSGLPGANVSPGQEPSRGNLQFNTVSRTFWRRFILLGHICLDEGLVRKKYT